MLYFSKTFHFLFTAISPRFQLSSVKLVNKYYAHNYRISGISIAADDDKRLSLKT